MSCKGREHTKWHNPNTWAAPVMSTASSDHNSSTVYLQHFLLQICGFYKWVWSTVYKLLLGKVTSEWSYCLCVRSAVWSYARAAKKGVGPGCALPCRLVDCQSRPKQFSTICCSFRTSMPKVFWEPKLWGRPFIWQCRAAAYPTQHPGKPAVNCYLWQHWDLSVTIGVFFIVPSGSSLGTTVTVSDHRLW